MDLGKHAARDPCRNVKPFDTSHAVPRSTRCAARFGGPALRFHYDDEWHRERDELARFAATIRRVLATLTRYMSIYRKFNRVPPDDLHHFERQRPVSNEPRLPEPSDWLPKRKAAPYEKLLATTVTWRDALPHELHPETLCSRFPRIANGLASGWRDRDSTLRCFDELLTDRRGDRQGFPANVLEELHALKAFYEALHSPSEEGWRRA